MKLQLDGREIRLRLTEAELARLEADGAVQQAWPCPDGSDARCVLALVADPAAPRCVGPLGDLRVEVPRTTFLAFAAERPRRDGFAFACGSLRVNVEVDVRDSHRIRGARDRPAQTAAD